MACTERGLSSSEEEIIYALADGLLQFQSIDVSSCPLENKLGQRLDAALFNIENNLVDFDDFTYTFSENKRFQTPIQLYEYLLINKPDEELHLTHGDFCLPNIFVTENKATGFIDMGRGGIGDKYQDIALCLRSLRYNTFKNDDKNLLFDVLGIIPDWEKIDYYILLDELF
ncbi:MAG: aminoglycoside 3'-phosphotransferase [Defluviitaleaceae bacterium]|nr:aminoglycoside 3'-phosphotransferase [Defluviitaleaceae bacterium]